MIKTRAEKSEMKPKLKLSKSQETQYLAIVDAIKPDVADLITKLMQELVEHVGLPMAAVPEFAEALTQVISVELGTAVITAIRNCDGNPVVH